MNFDWALTSVTSIGATLGRDVTPVTVQDVSLDNFALVRSYGLTARWTPTAKFSAAAGFGRQSRVFGGVATDSTAASTLDLQYAPMRALQLSMQFKHEARKSSTGTVLPYVANSGLLRATLSF